MLNKLKNREQGFTIIEVMIVLAIAGLIILIVLIAIPALQRSGRNTAMKTDAGAVSAAISDFKSSNDGKVPTIDATHPSADATTGVLTVSGAAGTSAVSGKVQPGTTVKGATGTEPATALAAGTIQVHKGQTCDGDTSARAVTVWYLNEPRGTAVVADNKCIDA